ncbi:MAG: methyltransferase domain-containing protein [Planctomycetes bacterium]|jgi:hypothetical protein|nr:methyltransferase domain-containing protein [Planctomycetota bacterium]
MTCPLCNKSTTWSFCRMERAPIFCNVLYDTYQQALDAPVGTIELAFCPECGLVYNAAYDPRLVKYSPSYENSLFFSPRFRAYAHDQAASLVESLDLHGKRIVEIGCGDGGFLSEICSLGENTGTGYDPAVRNGVHIKNVTLLPREFRPGSDVLEADLVLCRQVLEHVWSPREFLDGLRRSMAALPTPLFVEVPNGLWILGRGNLWDVIYEHCAYYTPPSLSVAMSRSGFVARRIEPAFEGQFLTVETGEASKPAVDVTDGIHEVEILVRQFQSSSLHNVRFWRNQLSTLREQNRRAVIWGAGSKGVTFLNALDVGADVLPYVVDINPRKQGKFVPASGQRVVAPQELVGHSPHVVIVMNPVYIEEIARQLDAMGIHCELMTV